MLDKKTLITRGLILFIILGVTFFLIKKYEEKIGSFFSTTYSVNKSSEKKISRFYQWQSAISLLNQLWNHPLEFSAIHWKESQCPDWKFLELKPDSLMPYISFRNPHYLQCFFSGLVPTNENQIFTLETMKGPNGIEVEIKVKFVPGGFYIKEGMGEWLFFTLKIKDSIKKQFYQFHVPKNMRGEYSKKWQLLVELIEPSPRKASWFSSTKNLSLDLYLQRSPANQYLPQGHYFYGASAQSAPSILWDNVGKDYYIDTYLVLQYQVDDYYKALGELVSDDRVDSLQHHFTDPNNLKSIFPATHLPLEDQKKFCEWRGAKLLTAHLFDAATFYQKPDHQKEAIENTKLPDRSLYPWGNIALEQMSKLAVQQKQQHCSYLKHSGCTQEQLKNLAVDDVTWMGLKQVAGGPFESIENTFNPEWNLKASSWYFPEKSRFHWNGHRLSWNGLGFKTSDINSTSNFDEALNFSHRESIKELDIGFRCYEEFFGVNH